MLEPQRAHLSLWNYLVNELATTSELAMTLEEKWACLDSTQVGLTTPRSLRSRIHGHGSDLEGIVNCTIVVIYRLHLPFPGWP
jgi:hypothetical protein